MTIDEAIQKYDTLANENMAAAAEWYQKYINYQDHDYKNFADKCEREARKYRQYAYWLEELKELREKVNCSEKPNSSDDLISRQAAIDALETVGYDFSESELSESELVEVCEAVGDTRQDMINRIKQLPSVQSELEDKIRAIGYTGKEGRIYIGGRLFAVRELPQ